MCQNIQFQLVVIQVLGRLLCVWPCLIWLIILYHVHKQKHVCFRLFVYDVFISSWCINKIDLFKMAYVYSQQIYFWCVVHLYFQVERPASRTPSVASGMDLGPPASLPSPRPTTVQSKRRKEFYLGSLPTSQISTQDPAPDGGYSSQRVRPSSPTPSSHRSLSSQRVPQFRSLSQASQPKKKSRMGF